MLIHTQHQLFKNLPSQFNVMRYHSLIVENINENELEIIATTKTNEVMAIAHKKLPIIGFQFHPESILTEYGIELLNNWKQLYL
jgi:anthranilate/para-aminobenzoate synthase component II